MVLRGIDPTGLPEPQQAFDIVPKGRPFISPFPSCFYPQDFHL
jgi:hypothetical protein